MIVNIEKLDAELKAVCPIDGVNSNGKISFKDEATTAQKEAAANVLKSFDDVLMPTPPPTKEDLLVQLQALTAQINALS